MNALWDRYQSLKQAEPRLRARDAAAKLGVSEGELLAADPVACPLRKDWAALLRALEPIGPVMALTRNEAAVHEKTGVYANVQIEGMMGLALNPDIDLRFFLSRWAHGFALAGERPSLQFFDAHGDAVHKIFAVDASDRTAFSAVVAQFADGEAGSGSLVPTLREPQAAEKADSDIDAATFQSEWLGLTDTHQFFGMLRRHGVTRTQALRLAPEGHAREVGIAAVDTLLNDAAASGLSIMVFVNNPGCVQIHTGPVHRITPMGVWQNVMDPGFNLHLRMDLFDRAWVVRKPTSDGIVTSLECFDAKGDLIVQCFGARKPGQPELGEWTALAAQLSEIAPGTPREEVSHA
ncbi:hemin-degrading factor [Pigmentiphaga aceris]|uniref:Hemin-degrading factor n=1 Tax=Pigmentiphaga aceris TaxID=1940612 RepID=A0A5C0AX18_9BURK|nr:ChuX/HutX family heme-like substrate-binding protein [Pigmentiphaga aceris]QEI06878.1 hemin-degrading factor [Pigmentiphaga aceris]